MPRTNQQAFRPLTSALVASMVVPASVSGQNLVPNPGFEAISCPVWFSNISDAPPWFNPTLATPDIYHRCATTKKVDVPKNDLGNQEPYEGDGYAGIFAYERTSDGSEWHEYVSVKLDQPMQAGRTYDVKFHVSLADRSKFVVGSMGAYFSVGAVNLPLSGNHLPFTPQIANNTGPLDDADAWTEISGSFVANGGEDHMIIGNFESDATLWVGQAPGIQYSGPFSMSYVKSAYYFIDGCYVQEQPDEWGVNSCPGASVTWDGTIFETESIGIHTNDGCGSASSGTPAGQSVPKNCLVQGSVFNSATDIDVDYWLFTLTEESEVTVTVDGEFEVDAIIATGGCPSDALVLAHGSCPAVARASCLPPGTYALVIQPLANGGLVGGSSSVSGLYNARIQSRPCSHPCCEPGQASYSTDCHDLVAALHPECWESPCGLPECEEWARQLCGCPTCIEEPHGMVSWWTLDDEATPFRDGIGGHDGIAIGTTHQLVPGKVDTCVQFDGIGGGIDVPHHPDHAVGTAAFSLDVWVNPQTFGDAYGTIAEKWGSTASSGWSLFCDPTSSPAGQLTFFSGTSTYSQTPVRSGAKIIKNKQWTHVAVTASAESGTTGRTIRLYLNGSLASTAVLPSMGSLTSTQPFMFGHSGVFTATTFGPSHFRGFLDEMHFYDRDLSGAEIAKIAASGRHGICKSVVSLPAPTGYCHEAGSVDVAFQVHNLGARDIVADVNAAPDLLGSGCSGVSIPGFTLHYSNPLSIPAGGSVALTMTLMTPPTLPTLAKACYRVSVTDLNTGAVGSSTSGIIHGDFSCGVTGGGGGGGSGTMMKMADLDGDELVNASDLSILIGNWGGTDVGDLNDDGIVGPADLALLLGSWSGA